ncbi:formimidoylglutamate deiminase [Actinoplanes regularis]|uniref:Formiminoglutamate deiminase n=1 Tax=Actinoplanes regularis TaxID=52697 RepID=A0A239BJ32_9ACTN|nr:formimidoylglutamate deiminase [Actinoplanes regularis]GIE88035.1 formimidoylglutamate deiminase [Actinoplanes regularis]SNS07649.1 formiminoglutamate deiminase [Actinoplanes regularis]
MTTYLAERAWVDGRVERDVRLEVADGRFLSVSTDSPDDSGVRLAGLVLPGMANAHSHAFHRALRGRTHHDRGSFWTWRDLMYQVAGRLDPDSYFELAKAVYAEMALAGITCVGEFHYLHHGPDGRPYADPNAMGNALIAAARAAGIRITLLDTVYLTSSVDGKPLEGVQRRFGDGDYDGWYERFGQLRGDDGARIGAALHSVRAAPVDGMATFARRTAGMPVHVHLSEQPAENEQCRAVHGCSPAELLESAGVWQPTTTAVHATHLTGTDRELLAGRYVCFCPTTERDLADGIGPARALADAGAVLTLGSDSHAVIDLFEEARGLELDERLATRQRGHFGTAELITAATRDGHASLGWADAGEIAVGQRADLVAVSLSSARTAGIDPSGLIFAATAADVTDVIVDGRPVVTGGRHRSMDVPAALRDSIKAVLT